MHSFCNFLGQLLPTKWAASFNVPIDGRIANNRTFAFASYALLRDLEFIVLYWRGGHCCPMHCDLFKIYCAPPNLGIRTWICRLNFFQSPIFYAWGSLTSLKSQTRTPSLKSLLEDLCSELLRLEKSIDLSRVWTRETWISRRALYSETTEADYHYE